MVELLGKIRTGLRFFGLNITVQTVLFSLYRDWLDFRYRDKGPPGRVRPPGKLLQVTATDRGVEVGFEHAELEVAFLNDRLAQVHWSPGLSPVPYAIKPRTWPEVRVRTDEGPEGLSLRTDELHITISKEGRVEFFDAQGDLLLRQHPPIRQGRSWTQPSLLAEEEAIYGLGERAAPMNLRGRRFGLWNRDPGGSYGPDTDPLYMSIPVYIGLHPHGSYLIFHENSFRGEISFQEQAIARFEGGALRYYFIPGPPNQALKEYLALTGRPPLPPRWALGYHQSRWGYTNERQVREVVEGFRRHELPLDVLHLDIDYMDGFRLFTVDKSRFPDLPGLAKELKENGVQFIPILDCGVKLDPKYPIYEQGIKHGHFLKDPSGKPVRALVWPGWSVFPDFTDSAVRSWWGGHYKTLIEAGAAGIWHDMNEPATFSAWGEPTLPIATRHVMEGRGGSHLEGHNLYGLLMGKAGYEGLKELEPKKRPWLLTRSGWAGIQRYAWHWTADTESTWEMLKQTIPSLLGLSLSGIPFSGPDIGGFSGSPEPELFLRWFQLATFVPFFRNHAAVGTPPREPWRFGPAILKILQKFLRLRVRLIPYLYTLAWEASQTGQPVLRPLFWDNLEDRELWNNDEAFMLGPDLLIAPIFEPGTQTRRQRLPAGDWYSFWDDNLLQGRGEVEAPVNLQTIPLFVRAGSILPMLADGQGIRANTTLALHLYPSEGVSTTSTLYNDAGDGYGAWRVDRYTMEQSGDELNIEWHQDAGDYLFPYKKINLHLHGFAASKVWIDGELLPTGEGPVQAGFFNLIRIEIARI